MQATTIGELIRRRRAEARMSQLDLALEAGVSARHLGFVELGRSRPSTRLLTALARSLNVPPREHNEWLLAAGFAPRYPEAPLSGADLERVQASLQRLLDAHDPYPGVAVDRRWDVQVTNQAARRLVAAIPERVRGTPTNVFRVALHPEGLAPRTANFAAWSAYLLQHLDQLARHDPQAAALAAEAEGWPRLPPRAQWARSAGPEPPGPVLCWEVSLGGHALRLYTMMARIEAAADITLSELTVELFYPADQATEDYLKSV